MTRLLFAPTLLALLGGSPPLAGATPGGDRPPNIVLVYADDHAEAAISACGSRINRTPHIDRLAATGMRFRHSFVANSICGPARATLLTGLHSHLNGKTTNQTGFDDELPTFAKGLRAAGYQTAVFGKWHLPTRPNGFDDWATGGGYYGMRLKGANGPREESGYCTDLITDTALQWIRDRDPERPFLVWVSHTATHRTWRPPTRHLQRYGYAEIPEPATLFDDYAGRGAGAARAQMRIARDLFPAYDLKLAVSGDGILDKNASGILGRMSEAERRAWDAAYGPRNAAFEAAGLEGDALVRWKYQRYIKDYLRCVDALDDSLGRILDTLEESGLADDTIVIYTSDQGFFLGEHGWYDKRWMYEPSLRTPLIVRWPGVTSPGSRCDAMVQNLDMAPTLLEMGEAWVPASMQGRSLAPLLRGETPDDWRDAVYYHYHQQDSGRTAHTVARHYGIRTERYKLIHLYDDDEWELYDLQEDPDEIHNRAGDPAWAELRERLEGRLRELRAESGDSLGER